MRKTAIERGLASVYAYIFSGGVLNPVCTPIHRDETGKLVAALATLDTDRKGSTVAGIVLTEVTPSSPVFYTFASVSRAARKAKTAVVVGREIEVNPRSRFGTELARLTGRTLPALVMAEWRAEQHDASTEGYTLQELDAALTEAYAQ